MDEINDLPNGQFGWNNPYVQIFDYLLYDNNLIFPVSIKKTHI